MSNNTNEPNSVVEKDFKKRVLKNGTMSALLVAAAVAVVILLNVVASKLPSSVKDVDLSGNLIYEVGEQSEKIIEGVKDDVKIYVVGEEGGIDDRIRRFLENYTSKSSHLTLEYVDPIKSPAFLSKHGLSEDSLLVRCEATGKEKVVPFSSIVVKQLDRNMYIYYQQAVYNEVSFDGEYMLGNAILKVTNPVEYKVYMLAGHEYTAMSESGQAVEVYAMGDNVRKNLEEIGATFEDLNLRTQGSVPADADLIILNSPGTDLTDEEIKALKSYMDQGGKMILYSIFTANPNTRQPIDLTNLYDFCRNYGIEIHNTYLGDMTYGSYTNASGGAKQDAFSITMKANGDDEIISGLSNQYMLIYLPQGLSKAEVRSSVTVTSLVESSTKAFLYPTELFTQDSSEIQFDPESIYGQYYMGLKAVETVEGKQSELVVLTGNFALDDSLADYYPGNLELTRQVVADCLGGDASSVNIPSKSLIEGSNTFTLTDRNVVINTVGAGVIAVLLPLILLCTGLAIWIRRRKR